MPYRFVLGDFGVGTYELTFPPGLDGVLESLDLQLTAGSSASIVEITNGSGDVLLTGAVGSAYSAAVGGPHLTTMQVIEDGETLQMTIFGGSCRVSLSGWLVSPPTATLITML